MQEVSVQGKIEHDHELDDIEHSEINYDITYYEDLNIILKFLPEEYTGFCPLCK